MDYINLLLPKIEHLGLWGYWIVFFSSFIESLAFVGLIFPGVIFLIFFGFLSSNGYLDIGDIFWFAATGSILGETISFYLGKKGKKIFSLLNLEKGKKFIKKYGTKSVFIARFIGPMRPIIPFLAGLFKMNTRQFFLWNILSAFCWAALYSYIGYFFGRAWRAIEVWSTRIGIIILCIIVLCIIFIMIRHLIIRHGKHFFSFIKTLSLSIWETIISNPDIKKFAEKNTALISFVRKRFSIKNLSGLPLTFIGLAFIYIIFLLFGIINGILKNQTIVTVDTNVSNLLYIFRHPALVKIFIWVTLTEEWQTMGFLIFSLTLLFIIIKKKEYILPLYLSTGGSFIFSILGKIIIRRVRPEGFIPVYIEDSFSFPSNHAALAVAVFGFLTYIIIKNVKNWKFKINIAFVGLLIILAIGFSRLYLGVHYLSDVLGGYLIGLMWLLISIVILEWQKHKKSLPPTNISQTTNVKKIIFGCILMNIVFFIAVGSHIQPHIITRFSEDHGFKTVTENSLINIFQADDLPQFSETLTGSPQEPLSFIIISKNEGDLIAAFSRSGWLKSDDISASHVLLLIQTLAFNGNYPRAPITPSFWNNTVNDYGFEKPVDGSGIRKRHHARIWKTNYRTDSSEQVFVGVASLDENIKWGITHTINPNIDAERETLFSDLSNSKSIITSSKSAFVQSLLGKNFTGDPFYTDGYVYIIKL